MAEVLELTELVHDNGVAEVQVGRSRIEAELHAEGPAGPELPDQVLLEKEFFTAAPDHGHLVVDVHRDPVILCLDELKLPVIFLR
jgi:hypothetical protein